jgi:hypothetical protein
MAFFTLAQQDGTIDKNIKMSEKEFELALLGMLQDSNAWARHQATHNGNHSIIPRFAEESEFDKKVNSAHGKKSQMQQEIVQYNLETKHFTAGCSCGQTFDINPRNFEVQEFNPMSKMKEQESYRKDDDRSSGRRNAYGMNVGNNSTSNSYGMNNVPKQQSGSKRSSYQMNVSGGYQS